MERSMVRFVRRRHAPEPDSAHGRRSGQSLVELAIIVPVLLLMSMGVFEFGRAAHAWIAVTHGARDGARWAMDPEKTDVDVRQRAIDSAKPLVVNASVVRAAQGRATVTVEHSFTTSVPLVSRIWGGGPLTIRRTMISEGDAL